MKELIDILKEIKSLKTMEFSKDFILIRAAINYTNDYIKPLQKIIFRSGNEGFILDLVTRLLRILREQHYLNDDNKPNLKHQNELRKITMFLILNTEINLKYDLKHDKTICHWLEAMPQISSCVLANCVWGLCLDNYFYEMIKYSPNWFVEPFLECVKENLKYVKPYETLEVVENLIKSIYFNVARSDFQVTNISEKQNYFDKFCEFTLEIMRNHLSPEESKMGNMKKLEFFKYFGYALKHVADLVLSCFDVFEKKPKFELEPGLEIFQIMKEQEKYVDNFSNNYSDNVQKCLININNILLNSLSTLCSLITVEIFMYWVEIDIDEETTLQRCVGEKIYKLIDKINMNACFDQETLTKLTNIAIKPRTLQDLLNEATIGQIMNKFETLESTDETRKAWMFEFVSRDDLVLNNQECLQTIYDNKNAITFESIKMLMKEFEKDEVEYEGLLKQIIIESLDFIDNKDQQYQIIEYSITNFGTDVDIFQMDNFDTAMIELFNKNFNDNFFKYLFQNPKLFFKKLYENLLKSPTQEKMMMEILVSNKEIGENYFDENFNHILNNFESYNESELSIISEFFADTYLSELMDRNEFISKRLYKIIMKSISDDNQKKVLTLINSFYLILKKSDFEKLTAPVLVMFAKILDESRWDIIRYTKELEEIVNKSIEMIRAVVKKFLPVATNGDRNWIKSQTTKFNLKTKYYFQKFDLNKDDEMIKFDEYLIKPRGMDQMTKNDNIAFLCENLVRCTYKELEWLASNPVTLSNFTEAIKLITIIVVKSSNNNSINCLRQLFLNYINILKSFTISSGSSDNHMKLFKELCEILKIVPEIIYNDLFLYIQQTLFDLIKEKLNENKTDILKIISNMKDCEGKEILLNKIEEN